MILMITSGFLLASVSQAQERNQERVWQSPNAATAQTIGLTQIEVTYGRPSVRDRDIFSNDGLVPFGQVWRTGANESTAITFPDNVIIEGEFLAAGVYSLYTIPGEKDWTIIFNDKLSWGTQYDESADVLRVRVQSKRAHFVEQLMIYFEDVTPESGTLVIHWERVKVPVRIMPDRELD